MKYKMVGVYTIHYVCGSVVEADSKDEAYRRFDQELKDVNAYECMAKHMGWNEMYVEEEWL